MLVRNDTYWGLKPTFDRIVFVFIQNPQAAFQTLLGLGTGRAPAPLSIVRGASDLPQFPIRQ